LEEIKSDQFDLLLEDFATLDERLTTAFKQLEAPSNWNILGPHPIGAYSGQE